MASSIPSTFIDQIHHLSSVIYFVSSGPVCLYCLTTAVTFSIEPSNMGKWRTDGTHLTKESPMASR